MRCISDDLIQKYVDNEISAKEKARIDGHLAHCSECAEKIEERREKANRIKELISSLHRDEIQVPAFREPERSNRQFIRRFDKVIYAAAAACLLVLFIIFLQKPEDDVKIIYSFDIDSEYNANLPLSEQEMVIEIFDSEGKLISY